jgi:hypothetical protein
MISPFRLTQVVDPRRRRRSVWDMLLMFHLSEGTRDVFDDEGVDCESLDDARRKALAAAREIIAAQALKGRVNLDARIDVTDDTGRVVLCVPFSDAVTIGNA